MIISLKFYVNAFNIDLITQNYSLKWYVLNWNAFLNKLKECPGRKLASFTGYRVNQMRDF